MNKKNVAFTNLQITLHYIFTQKAKCLKTKTSGILGVTLHTEGGVNSHTLNKTTRIAEVLMIGNPPFHCLFICTLK